MPKVLLGMSGGIDSSVSAMLLQEQGYEVVGCTFRTFDSIRESCLAHEKGCCSIESIMEAKQNAKKMGIDHHIVDFRPVFEEHIIRPFVTDYLHGRTPNPCVRCNGYIKWGELLKVADEYGCEYVATGHYARVRDGFLRKAVDTAKDQTYFLWMLTEENLRRTIFPLGELTKPQVREIARQHGYEKLAVKTESQDICFVPNGDYRSFLDEYCHQHDMADSYRSAMQTGDFVDATGRVVGKHSGFANYTIGQRKGLGVALGYPAFVTGIEAEKNIVSLGRREELLTRTVYISDFIFRGDANRPVEAKIRYRSAGTDCRVYAEGDRLRLEMEDDVWGVTPGQSCVLYQDECVVGGGIIRVEGLKG